MSNLRKLLFITLPLILCLSTAPASYGASPKSCGAIQTKENGTPYPVVCSDGSPNSNATSEVMKMSPYLMKLSRSASDSAIKTAICKDLAAGTATNSHEMASYEYQYALYDWEGLKDSSQKIWDSLAADTYCPSTPYVSHSSTPIKNKKSNLIRYVKPLSEFKTLNDINDYEIGLQEGISSQYEYLSGIPFDTKGLNELSVKFCNKNIFFNISWNYVSKLLWSEAKKAGFYEGCTSFLK